MFRNLPIRQKLYLWGGGLLVVSIVIVIYLGFIHEAYTRYQFLTGQTDEISQASEIIHYQNLRLDSLDKTIIALSPNILEINSHNALIQYVQTLCTQNDLKLITLPSEDIHLVGEYKVAEISLSWEGNYRNTLKGLFQLEQTDYVATIKRLNLHIETIRKNYKEEKHLVSEIVLNRLIE